jgi:methionyl-tRNA formyltransferase
LVAAGHDVAMVVTRPDKRRGREQSPTPSPVKAAALELGLPVVQRAEELLGVGAELGVVVAYGRMIKPEVLDRLPMVNAHFSLLPRWRGAAPVERAILAGDSTTGVCLMALDEGLDTGPVYAREEVAIGPEETADELRDRLADLAAGMLVEHLESGLGTPVVQSGEATYAAKIEPADRHLDWDRPAVELHRVVRVGRAWTLWRGRRLLVEAARVELDAGPDGGGPAADGAVPGQLDGPVVTTGAGRLRLVTVQPEGKAVQDAAAWLRGARPRPGELLGQ